jgi:hypothetical protein
MPTPLTAAQFVTRLKRYQSDAELKKYARYFKLGEGEYGEGDRFIGVRMGQVFALAKEFIDLPPAEIEKLMVSPIHEVRAGALSIMDKQARRKQTPLSRRKELYDLYRRNHAHINNWDLVDLAAPYVVGGYLHQAQKPRTVLDRWARSRTLWERRSAIVSTLYFVRQGDVDDAFRLAAQLLNDEHDLIHKAVGWALRAAGDVDRPRLLRFLDEHAATMPRTMLRYALEHFEAAQRQHYLSQRR